MTWLQEHSTALLFLTLYTALLARHAWVGRRQTRGLADFYVGGRSMGGVAVGLSFFATFSSTNSFVGFSGQSYSYGTPWLLLAPFVVLFCLIAWTVIAPRLRHFTASLNSLTLPDFFGFRYSSRMARVQAAAIVIFASVLYMTAIFKGIGHALEISLGIPYSVAILIVLLIVVTYTAVGGFISVVKTDVVQGIMLILAAILLFSGTVRASGGLESFFAVRKLPEGAALFSWNVALPFPMLLGILFAGSLKFLVEPRQLSRFYALKDRRAVRTGMWISTLSFLLVYTLLLPIGIYARNIFPTGISDTDRVVPMLLADPQIFEPVLSAFLLVTLVAAAMSSLDSVLLIVASTCHRDIFELFKRSGSEEAAVRNTGLYVLVFAIITALVALDPPGEIVTLTAFSGSVYAACFFPGLFFGLYWRPGNGKALTTSFIVGLASLMLWSQWDIWPAVHEVFPAFILSITAYVTVALITEPVSSPEVDRLFNLHQLG